MLLDKNGLAVSFDDYKDVVIPKDCVGLTDKAYENLIATANERESIYVEKGNEKFKSAGNCLVDVEQGKIVLGCKNSLIPDDGSIKIIGAHSFNGIGSMDFENRDIFTQIAIPEGVKKIEHHAFADSGVIDMELPDGLEEIGSMAFMLSRMGKEGRSIFLPPTVNKMGIGVFMGCTELRRPRIFSERYKSEGDCICDVETKTIIAVHNGTAGEILPHSADKIEMLTFMGQRSGARYYFEDNIKEIKLSLRGFPSFIEFPITIVTHKGTYAYKFALENNIPYEVW